MSSKLFSSASLSLFAFLCIGALPATAQTANYGGVVTTLQRGLNVLQDVAVDSNGNVYIADGYQSTIEELVAVNGSVPANPTVLKLGSGFNHPEGLAVDANGNVYVADIGDHSVKEIVAVNGSVPANATVVTLSSSFTSPHDITVDASGNVYLIDASASSVTEIQAVNGVIPANPTTISLGSGLKGAYGLALDGNGNVYVADTGNSAVKEISGNASVQSLGRFNHPQSVAVDAAGNVFIADTNDRVIKEIIANDFSTVVTVGSEFPLAKGIAVDGLGNVYVADASTGTVQEINLGSKIFGSVALGATASETLIFNFTAPGSILAPGVFTQGATGLDFTDAGTGTCTTQGTGHVYNAGDSCTVVINFKPGYAGTRNGAVTLSNGSGTVIATAHITGVGDGPQVIFRPGTKSNVGNINGHSQVYPTSVALDGNGNVFFVDENTFTLYEILAVNGKISNNPTMRPVFSAAPSPGSVAIDGAGNVFVANGSLYMLPAVSGSLPANPTSVFLASGGIAAVAVDGAGNVYFIGEDLPGTLQEIPAVNGSIPTSPAVPTPRVLASGLAALGLAVDGNGNVYVADAADGLVKEIVAVNGHIAANPTILSVGSGFKAPYDVKVDGVGNVYVADDGTDAIYEMVAVNGSIPASPTILTLADSTSGLISPWGVAVDQSGNVYVADYDFSRVPNDNQLYKLDYADAPRLNFLPTPPGQKSTDSPQTVTIANIGNENLLFSLPSAGTNPSISNQFALENTSTCPALTASSTTPAALPPATSCTELVDFVPQKAGSIPGSLIFTDNAIPATQTVVLNGNVEPTLAAPVLTPAPGTYDAPVTVTMSDSALIYYTTDGTNPTVNSSLYANPITVPVSEVVKAIAIAPGFKSSPVTTYSYHLVPDAPVFNPAPGNAGPDPLTVTLTDTAPGVSYYYTTDGSVPTTSSNLYSGSITLTSTSVLRAIAVKDGWSNSAATFAKYIFIAPTPVITPVSQDFQGSIIVTITDSAPNAKIFYSYAGNTPETTSAPVYTGPITVTRTETIKAIAVLPNERTSAIAEQDYVLTK